MLIVTGEPATQPMMACDTCQEHSGERATTLMDFLAAGRRLPRGWSWYRNREKGLLELRCPRHPMFDRCSHLGRDTRPHDPCCVDGCRIQVLEEKPHEVIWICTKCPCRWSDAQNGLPMVRVDDAARAISSYEFPMGRD